MRRPRLYLQSADPPGQRPLHFPQGVLEKPIFHLEPSTFGAIDIEIRLHDILIISFVVIVDISKVEVA